MTIDLAKRAVNFARRSTSSTPTLAPYRPVVSPFVAVSRKTVVLAMLIFVGLIYGAAVVMFPPSFVVFMGLPLAVGAILVIWALPDRESARVGPVKPLLFIFVLVAFAWPNYLAIALPGLPWISVQRLVLFPLTLLLGIGLSTSLAFRDQIFSPLRDHPAVLKMGAAFILVQVASCVVARYPFDALNALLNFQFVATVVFLTAIYAFRDRKDVKRLYTLIALLALYLCIMALLEYRNKQVLWANHIPWFLRVEAELLDGIIRGGFRAGIYRVKAIFPVSLSLSELLAMMTPFVIYLFFASKSWIGRLPLVALDVLVVTVILFTESRLGLIGTMVAHVVSLLIWGVRRWRNRRESLFGPALTLAFPVVLALLCVAVVTVQPLRVRVIGGGATQASNEARKAQWAKAPSVLVRSPVIGYGPNLGGEALGHRNAAGVLSIDSYVLSILLDHGILGFILYFGMIIVVIITGFRLVFRDRSTDHFPIVIAPTLSLVVFLTTKFVLSQDDTHSLAYLCMGLIIQLSASESTRYRKPADLSRMAAIPGP